MSNHKQTKKQPENISNKQKVFKTGNSLVVVIPSVFKKSFGVREGDFVNVKANLENQTLTYKFLAPRQLTLLQKKNDKKAPK